MISNSKAKQVSVGISSLIFIFLVWFIYSKNASSTSLNLSWLPLLNSIFNGCSALSLGFGLKAILNKNKRLHKRWMVSALSFSACFLISYLIYHYFHGDTLFMGQGIIRPIYFFILITHIILTMFVLPLILMTVFYALTTQFQSHKKIARWTFPLWMYVSITGIIIYLMQQI